MGPGRNGCGLYGPEECEGGSGVTIATVVENLQEAGARVAGHGWGTAELLAMAGELAAAPPRRRRSAPGAP